MRSLSLALALSCLPLASTAFAQGHEEAANPLSDDLRSLYQRVQKYVLASAEAMPEKEFDFKPTPEVRSFGQLLGHVADAQYHFCAAIRGEKAPDKDVEKTATTKAALQKALAESFAYCDPAFAKATDATLSRPVELFGGKKTHFFALDLTIAHDNEHYGNLVTYLRMKNITPPSTQEREAAKPKK